jgi:hypothetical protein
MLVAVVDRFELAAINGDARVPSAGLSIGKGRRTHAHLADRGPVILAKVGNRLVIADQPADQSHVNPSSNHAGIVPQKSLQERFHTARVILLTCYEIADHLQSGRR